MKVVLFAALAVCAISVTQGTQFLSQCNDGEAQDACAARVAAQFQNQCVQVIPGDAVSVLTCDTANCGENTKLVEGDKTKPYPSCCPTCAIVDPSKPAQSTIVG
ncbi:uncharacterized protein LOC106657039 [Trichogramma pretiosum]|uniref:uncharacterized protein LOC106657039 n=1 Tax=Trichogramma pretiosum TaxID=7493 RepID=UPI0006C96845|nr:uncharacterized protein LOC106657039 [Trichogramma pretiosum]